MDLNYLNLKTYMDDKLQGHYENPVDAREYVTCLMNNTTGEIDGIEKAKLLGNIGVILLHLRDLDQAEYYLKKSIVLINDLNLYRTHYVQQSIRLANVFQWKKDFVKADKLFIEIIELCNSNENCLIFLDFALQHYGKSLFDQQEYLHAIKKFEAALALRINKGDVNLIANSKLAIKTINLLIKC